MSQLFVNASVTAGHYALIGVAFALVYRTDQYFNCALAIAYAAGAYIAYSLHVLSGCPIVLAACSGILSACLMGLMSNWLLFAPLRRRGSSTLVLFLTSLGTYIVLQNIASLIWGDATRTFHFGVINAGYSVFGARISPYQVVAASAAICCIFGLWVAVRSTRTGLCLRSLARDPELACVVGARSDLVWSLVYGFAAALAGLAGILGAYEGDLRPTMGFSPLLMGIVACLIGGSGLITGPVLGAIVLATLLSLSEYTIGAKWKECIAFMVLILYLVCAPAKRARS